ncbi:MAG: ComEC/Rec2 family competence protein [Sediminicola sp.]|tara:strand:- start:142387 stop:144375 length:1989 start_codon:yes stop_codon:yes gene_type:complete
MAGIILGRYLNIPLSTAWMLVFASFLALSWAFIKHINLGPPLFGIFAAITTMGIGICTMLLSKPQNQLGHYTHHITEDPAFLHLKVYRTLAPNSFADRYIATVLQVGGHRTHGEILLTVPSDSIADKLRVDSEIQLHASLQNLPIRINPHQFDYASFLSDNGIYKQLYAPHHNFYTVKEYAPTIYGTAADLRERIMLGLRKNSFGKEELGIVQALLLGDRSDIASEVRTHYQKAGALHILAVSGLHIGIFLLLLHFVLRPLEMVPYGRMIKLPIIAIILWAFAFVAGLSASVVRAVTMFSFLAYAMFLNRPTSTFNILALSLFFTLLFRPLWLFHVGFQMSYAAVFAIIWIYPLILPLWRPKWFLLKKGWQLTVVGIAAQLGVFPIALYYFHQFPGLFLISNLAIVPFLGCILGFGILVIVLALCNALPPMLALYYNALIGQMNRTVAWIGSQEDFVFNSIPFDGIQLIISYGAVMALASLLTKSSAKKWMALLVFPILFQTYLIWVTLEKGKLEEAMVLHRTRNSILLYRKGPHLTLWTRNSIGVEGIKNDYVTGERLDSVTQEKLYHAYGLGNAHLYVLDSLAIYPPKKLSPTTVLLTQSPNINLQRFIDSVQPKLIIADGSNYRSDIDRWQATCQEQKVPFHYTGTEGAYVFDISEQNQ